MAAKVSINLFLVRAIDQSIHAVHTVEGCNESTKKKVNVCSLVQLFMGIFFKFHPKLFEIVST